MPTLKEIIEAQDKLRTKNVELFQSRMRAYLGTYLERTLRLKGQDLADAVSTISQLQKALETPEYQEIFQDFQEFYAEELTAISKLYSQVNIDNVLTGADREVVEALVNYDYDRVTRLISPYIDDIGSSVLRGVIAGDTLTVQDIIDAGLDIAEGKIKTEVDTLLSGFSRTVSAYKAEQAGLELFEYIGANDDLTRDFCGALLDDRDPPIYTREEINAMDNGQRLDVMTYGGGYNCRHQWVAIPEDYARELGWKPEGE
jgi:hypothetical protein